MTVVLLHAGIFTLPSALNFSQFRVKFTLCLPLTIHQVCRFLHGFWALNLFKVFKPCFGWPSFAYYDLAIEFYGFIIK